VVVREVPVVVLLVQLLSLVQLLWLYGFPKVVARFVQFRTGPEVAVVVSMAILGRMHTT